MDPEIRFWIKVYILLRDPICYLCPFPGILHFKIVMIMLELYFYNQLQAATVRISDMWLQCGFLLVFSLLLALYLIN